VSSRSSRRFLSQLSQSCFAAICFSIDGEGRTRLPHRLHTRLKVSAGGQFSLFPGAASRRICRSETPSILPIFTLLAFGCRLKVARPDFEA
jgi:hypothetical protein